MWVYCKFNHLILIVINLVKVLQETISDQKIVILWIWCKTHHATLSEILKICSWRHAKFDIFKLKRYIIKAIKVVAWFSRSWAHLIIAFEWISTHLILNFCQHLIKLELRNQNKRCASIDNSKDIWSRKAGHLFSTVRKTGGFNPPPIIV